MRLVLGFPVNTDHVAQIQAVVPHWEVIVATDATIASELLHADVFAGHAKVPVPWADIVRQGRLKWIQSSAAGLDHCLTPEVVASDIVVSSASGLFADQVAEQAMALLLGITRSLPDFMRAAQRREFIRMPTRDLHGKTVGIVGFGGNGRRLAAVLAPWRVRILATDMFPVDKPATVEALVAAEQLGDILPECDAVILCLPLNERTRGLVDAQILAKMKRDAILINVARGAVVREADLVAALKGGRIGAAGLDVTEIEPLPHDSPLWDMPNVLITPHVGAQSERRVSDTVDFFCANLKCYLSGEPLINRVDKDLGFPRPEARAKHKP